MPRRSNKPSTSKKPSTSDWERHKDEIISVYESKGLNAVMEHMSRKDFHAKAHNYNYRFDKWQVEKYIRREKAEKLFDQLLDNHKNNVAPPQLTMQEVVKLRRHLKAREKKDAEKVDPVLRHLLNKLQESSLLSSAPLSPTSSTQRSVVSESQEESSDASDDDDTSSDASAGDFDGDIDGDFDIVGPCSSQSMSQSRQGGSFDFPLPRIQLHSADRSEELNELLQLTRAQYEAGVQNSLTRSPIAGTGMGWTAVPGSMDDSESLAVSFSFNKTFWTKVKSGIYFFKMGTNSDIASALRLLKETSTMIGPLCEQQPFTMWKDIFATLSPVNIAIKKDLLSNIMRTFTISASQTYAQHPDHPLALICSRLESEDLFAEACTAGLHLLLEISTNRLPDGHEETYEIERALVRLYRRQGKLSDAERVCRNLIGRSEKWHGTCSLRTRLAMTELVYIYNDQGKYHDSKALAEAVVEKCREDLGAERRPDQKYVYAMEDVAFICDKLGQMEDSVYWLRKAQKEALSLWSDKEGTEHITRKLEAAQAKLGRGGKA